MIAVLKRQVNCLGLWEFIDSFLCGCQGLPGPPWRRHSAASVETNLSDKECRRQFKPFDSVNVSNLVAHRSIAHGPQPQGPVYQRRHHGTDTQHPFGFSTGNTTT